MTNRYHHLQKKILTTSVGTLFLKGLSYVYGFFVYIRHMLYDFHILRSVRLPTFVVSVGNITAGGTGKTPFVLKLLGDIDSRSNVALLSRGYKKDQLSKSKLKELGDEPFLINSRFPEIQIGVHPNRLKAFFDLPKQPKLTFLDDGMQHRRLKRDIDICLIRQDQLFPIEPLLPLGVRRDLISRIQHVDYVVITHGQKSAIADVKACLIKHRFNAKIIAVDHTIKGFQDHLSHKKVKKPSRVFAFCALGYPEGFVKTLEKHGVQVVGSIFANDHEEFSSKQLANLAKVALQHGARALCCTEKDAVKINDAATVGLPVIKAQLDLQVTYGKKHYEELISKLKAKAL